MSNLPTHPAFVSPSTPARRVDPPKPDDAAGTNLGHVASDAASGPKHNETPLREKKGESAAVTVNDLSGKREAAIADAGSVHPEVTLENFFLYLLPLRQCLSRDDIVKTIVEKLKEGDNALLKEDPKLGKFVFHDIISKQAAKKTEKKLFTTLEDIARRIEEIVGGLAAEIGEKLEPVTRYKDAPASAPMSFNRTSGHIPDGYFILCIRQEEGPIDYWIDIGVVGEFKRGKGRQATNKDVRQIVWDMHHILREDERRRFTIGFTIEKSSMRLWYVNRSDIFVSECFDFVSSPEYLVRFFLAVTYAYEYRLGWDPTMKYVAATETESRHLLITGRSADAPHSTMLFKTVDILSNVGTEAIRGRGTRVWRVEAVEQDGKPFIFPRTYVLKDNWIDSDREREGAILKSVRAAAENLQGPGRQILLDALLTVVMYGDVWIDQQSAPDIEEGFYDSTFTAEQRKLIHPSESGYVRLQRPAIDDATEDQITTAQSQARGNTHSVYERTVEVSDSDVVVHDPRTHSRIAFAEVCKPIHEERQLPRIYLALSSTCAILQALHSAGWLHRDISGGNIMLWHNRVKIADFEYAKKFEAMKTAEQLKNDPHHSIRTGTPLYTSIEVDTERFLFGPESVNDRPRTTSRRPAGKAVQDEDEYFITPIPRPRAIPVESPLGPAKVKPVWQYNPLHDVESLSWLAKQLTINRDLYFVLAEYPDVEVYAPDARETPQARRGRLIRQAAAAQTLRPKQLTRGFNLTTPGFLATNLETLHPLLQSRDTDPESRSVAEALEEIRQSLVATYKEAEQDPMQITNSIAKNLCKSMGKSFYQAACSLTMVNHIPCVRPLDPELYHLGKQDMLAKDLNERPPPAAKSRRGGSKRSSAKPTPSTSAIGTTNAAAKRKHSEAEPKTSKPEGNAAELMDVDESDCPPSPSDDAQTRKKRKGTT